MRQVRLDYIATSGTPVVGTIMLVLGLLLASWAVLEYRSVREERLVQEASAASTHKAAKASAASSRRTAREAESSPEEFKVAQLALQRLLLRWDELFNALESTGTIDVALLAIEPDAAMSAVKLTAEARTAEDMLAYVDGLQTAAGLTNVVLASHQVKAGDPLQPMRFVVLASWVVQP